MIKNSFIRILLFLVAAVWIGDSSWDLITVNDLRKTTAVAQGTSVSENIKNNLDSLAIETRQIATVLSNKISAQNLSKDELLNLIREVSSERSFISGANLAFESGAYLTDENEFGYFYHKREDRYYKIVDNYDYKNSELESSIWYTSVIDEGKSALTEPHFSKITNQWVVDYAVPVVAKNEDKTIGVVTVTISLNRLSGLVRRIVDGSSGYVYLTDAKGNIITHPDRSYIMNRAIYDF